ncbi:PEX25 [[Candida] subhashii]|uniref:PEX25 n=1 Tax=[Candida] subhashii TaxID=561895 RepID=A0A8J5UHF4_9ASCO|nr:PEX25 [[Candida] subhashii]KAG7660812.1 PEX25 [[Candida] subhashii]
MDDSSNNNILITPSPFNPYNSQHQLPIHYYSRSPLHPSYQSYSSQPHTNQQQQIDYNLYNSEWKDTSSLTNRHPNNSNNNNNNLLIMPSTIAPTIQQQQQIPDTPTKSIDAKRLIYTADHNINNKPNTPNDFKRDDYIKIETVSIASSTSSSSTIINNVPHIKNWDIFWAMLNDIVGKDKLAKIGQYILRLLLHHSDQLQTYLSDDNHLNINIIQSRYNDTTKRLNLIKNFIKHPQDFIKIVAILFCSIFEQKFNGVITGLSMYRQLLRFGKTPFKIRELLNKLSNNISITSKQGLTINKSKLFNKSTLGNVFSIYYGINDESLLLYKLGVLSNKSYKKFASRHESFGWYCETWLAMYNAVDKLNILSQQEMDIKISIQVRNKAKILSRQLLGVNPNLSNHNASSTPTPTTDDLEMLAEIKFKKDNCWLDIYKNLADLAFNSYTVFKIPLPFATWQIWMGISAALLSTTKLYRETKKKLIEKEMSKIKFD